MCNNARGFAAVVRRRLRELQVKLFGRLSYLAFAALRVRPENRGHCKNLSAALKLVLEHFHRLRTSSNVPTDLTSLPGSSQVFCRTSTRLKNHREITQFLPNRNRADGKFQWWKGWKCLFTAQVPTVKTVNRVRSRRNPRLRLNSLEGGCEQD